MTVRNPRRALLIPLFVGLLVAPELRAFGKRDRVPDLHQLNARMAGKVHDYTANHGQDNRIDAPSLGERRDAYVYVPPGYDPAKRYPLVVWLHGLNQDEKSFLEIAEKFDGAIVAGRLPKFVAVCADATARGRTGLREPPTLYLNSPLGRFEDFITVDVWNHVVGRYSIHADRKARALTGASMGAFGAYNLGIKNKAHFGVVAGVLAPLNLRYADCRGRTDTDFDPHCVGWVNEYRPNAPVARFACGLVTIRQRQLIAPVFGEGPDVIAKVAAQNPAEMLTAHDVKPGDLEMFVGSASRDEFNFDAQAESFAAIARGRGLTVNTILVPGKHDKETGVTMLPAFVDFLRPRLEPYAPKD